MSDFGSSEIFERPKTLDRALTLLGERQWRVLAGGTDLYPATDAPFLRGAVLDINDLDELCGIEEGAEFWRIGARTTWSEVIAADLPPCFEALKLAGREVGAVQIQNAASVGGNLCNASPAADGVPALLILDGEVELQSAAGTRRMPLQDFICGNRRTLRRPDELMTAILCPKDKCAGRSHFLKIGARKYLVISIAMVAARVAAQGDVVSEAPVAVGSCSETARRLPTVEHKLAGLPHNGSLAQAIVADDVRSVLSPIDDVRASAAYRERAAVELVRRAVTACTGASRASVVS